MEKYYTTVTGCYKIMAAIDAENKSVPFSPYRFFGFQAAYLIGTPNTPNEAGLSDVVPVGIAF